MGSKFDVPVFTETSLGTRVVIPVLPDTTAGEFKRKLERAHIDSFPELGKVTSSTVMVKKKSNFYCLPDFLPIKHAFQGCKSGWFVQVEAYPSNKPEIFSGQERLVPVRRASRLHVNDHIKLNQNNVKTKHKKAKLRGIWFLKAVIQGFMLATYATRKKKKRKRTRILKKVHKEDNTGFQQEYVVAHKGKHNDQKEALEPARLWDSSDTAETPCESMSGAASVSGIIDRYFSSLVELDQIDSSLSSEVATRAGQNQLKEEGDVENTSARMPMTTKRHSLCETNQRLLPSPLSEDLNSVGLRNKYQRSEVGDRLVVASNSLQKSELSKKGKKFLEIGAGSTAKGLVFEIGDDDD